LQGRVTQPSPFSARAAHPLVATEARQGIDGAQQRRFLQLRRRQRHMAFGARAVPEADQALVEDVEEIEAG
jgi:hypothetical protein